MANGMGPADRSDWVRLLGLVILAALSTAIVGSKSLDASRLHGRLSVPPLYDDVAYFGDAVGWMNAFGSRGVAGSVWDLVHHHAPFSTLVAATGFRLFPGGYVGPYLVHAVIVFGFLLGII